MAPHLPLCCSSRGFDLLKRQLPILNSPDALLNGAIAIAMHQIDDVTPGDVDADGGQMLLDAFAGGRILNPDEAHSRLQEMFGPEVEWSEDLLRPASNRHWLTRMLQNLLNVFGSGGHYNDVAAVLEMEMLL